MKNKNFKFLTYFLLLFISLSLVTACSDDDSSEGTEQNDDDNNDDENEEEEIPVINFSSENLIFNDTEVGNSSLKNLVISGEYLTNEISLITSGDFLLSIDNENFSEEIILTPDEANNSITIKVKFTPSEFGEVSNTISVTSADFEEKTINLNGEGITVVSTIETFNSTRVAFGGGYNQTATETFNLPENPETVSNIKMFVKLRCPDVGCDEWDVYANVRVKDDASGEFFEMARYITPYWNDNSQLPRGFEFDVTDFKSLLTGSTELQIKTECWNDRGYLISVEFDYEYGEPDYPYYSIERVMAYNNSSIDGVPYGVSHNLDLDKSVTIPSNAQSTHLRTIISGWGHATPYDTGGRPCAEWCFRTHHININGTQTFEHYMGPMGCAQNPVSNQAPGNWAPDRAGWCPGMEVPTRIDVFSQNMAGSTFTYEYDYEDWVNDGANGDAYYATSTFVVVKSTTEISKPTVND
ncbi:peptide-N-glycosidase F-related protein [Mesonia sp.]|uniref:peptide-N-glycosidase F-related protein n=1 Tax=Mesonia sp. TaxID=1960830 RepID=UPI001774B6F4|nr:peptide-N-glycosidase F-related protein [Mesonia sp.]HIB37341.1 peptidase [Mesonia sp.]HIO27453.1 peptidase [Flavobacteriaceae bacterium]